MTKLVETTGQGGVVATSQPVDGAGFVQPWLSLDDYISFTVMVSLVFGLAFEMPLVVILLVRVGILKREKLKKFRKYVFFIIVVLAAIITPTPDVMTMMAMAVPMYLLYEIGLALAKPPDDAIEVSEPEPPT
jgi:Sec-independent protein secretion pathway component TatC